MKGRVFSSISQRETEKIVLIDAVDLGLAAGEYRLFEPKDVQNDEGDARADDPRRGRAEDPRVREKPRLFHPTASSYWVSSPGAWRPEWSSRPRSRSGSIRICGSRWRKSEKTNDRAESRGGQDALSVASGRVTTKVVPCPTVLWTCDLAAVARHQLLGDGQPQPRPLLHLRLGVRRPVELLVEMS